MNYKIKLIIKEVNIYMEYFQKYKLFFLTFIMVHLFIWGVYYFTSVGIANNTLFLQMRRYIPCALSVAIAVNLWHSSGYALKKLLPHATVGVLWVFVYPVCYWLAYHSNTTFIDKHFDQALGAYIFAFTACMRLLFLWYKIDNKVVRCLFAVLHTLLIVIPVTQLLYYFYYQSPITEAASMALLQTNKNEAKEYLLLNLGYSGIVGVIILYIAIFTAFYYLNSVNNDAESVPQENNTSVSKKMLVAAMVVIAATIGYGQKMFWDTGVMQSYVFAKDYFNRANKFKAFHDENFANLIVTPSVPQFSKPSTIIMVIGESASRYYMSAYNNTKNNNTPWLREARKNDNFIIFNHAYTSWGQTVPSLERALTEKNQYNDMEFNKCLTVLDIAKKAGYTTHWYSNQGSISDADTPITLVAKTADYSGWICDEIANTNSYKYDGDLLKYLENIDRTKNNFIVLHFMGSHEDCINRYPYDFAKFSEKGKFDMVLNYDDSLAYTDYVLQEVYEYAVKNLNLQAMLYFSDHGGDPYRKRHPDESGFKFLRIPMFVYVSDEYKNLYPGAVAQYKKSENKYYTNDLNYELVCELLQIKSNHYQEENSILSKQYKFTRNTLTTNLGRRKLSEDKGEQ